VSLRLWLPVVLWAGVLFFASALSGPELGEVGRIPDWITHGSAYAVFGLLVGRALAGGFGRPLGSSLVLATVLACTLYGISDEFHQSFVPGRDASAGDVAKDLGGALLGALGKRRMGRT
jgi:VanZ family protein